MKSNDFNKVVSTMRKFTVFVVLILVIAFAAVLAVKGLTLEAVCVKSNVVLHYIVMCSIIFLLPLAYLIYIPMVRKATKIQSVEEKLGKYYSAYLIRTLILCIVGLIACVAYFFQPVKNYLFLLLAIVIIIMLYFPTPNRLKTELQINDAESQNNNNNTDNE